nr:MAG TPA: hypothetical protein [Caudoviricetes sp.]
MKFSENLNIFNESVRLTCNNSHLARPDSSNLYSNAIRHCKRLVLRLILTCLIKSMSVRLKALKTSNTRL